MRQGKRHITYDSTNQLVSAANAQTYALSVTYGDWGKIQQYGLQQTDLGNNTTTSQTRYYSYGSLSEGQTAFAPNNISYADGTDVNEQYGIGGSLQRRETNIPGNQPETEHYRFTANGNLRAYMYENLLYVHYGYNDANTRTYKYSFDLNPNWVNGRLESVNFNPRTAMFYPNSYLNFNSNGYYTKHYYNGMERIASRLGDQALSISTHDPDLQDRKDWQDSLIRKNVTEITGYEFLEPGEEQTLEDPKPVFELPQVGITGLHPIGSGSVYYYHPNHLGSTCYVTDGNASVQQGFLYAPFGEITNEHNSSFGNGLMPKYSFNAKELDEETGFYYYEARYYNPPTFISRDPLFEKYPTFSPYAYCANNPVKYVDPDGRDWYEAVNSETNQKEIKWTDYHSQKELDANNVIGKYLGETHIDWDNSTYYSLYGGILSYDKNNQASFTSVMKIMTADNLIKNAVNGIGHTINGSKTFWDKHNDMFSVLLNMTSTVSNGLDYKPLKKTLKPINALSAIMSIIDYKESWQNETLSMSDHISLASNLLSFVPTYGPIISLYLNGVIWSAKQGSKAESTLRNYFSPCSSNNFFKNCFGY